MANGEWFTQFGVGDKVRVKEGFPGVVTEVYDGPGGLTSYAVVLDAGFGYGEWNEVELTAISGSSTAATTADLTLEGTAATDYPELSQILMERLPIRHTVDARDYHGGRVTAASGLGSPDKCAFCDKPPEFEARSVDPFGRVVATYYLCGDHQNAGVTKSGPGNPVRIRRVSATEDEPDYTAAHTADWWDDLLPGQEMPQCAAVISGVRCTNDATEDSPYCHLHEADVDDDDEPYFASRSGNARVRE